MRSHFSLKLYAVIASLFFYVCAYAGLGEIQVNSRLGEPFKAQILLVDFKNKDLASLKIQLKGDIPLNWQFNSTQGEVFLIITSEQAVNALPLRFLVFGFLPTERISREYSVSFDGKNTGKKGAAKPVAEGSEVVSGVSPIKKKSKKTQEENGQVSEMPNQSDDDLDLASEPVEQDWLSQIKGWGTSIAAVLAGLPALLPPELADNLLVVLAAVGLFGLLLFWRHRSAKKKVNLDNVGAYASTEVTSINFSARDIFEGDSTMLAELTRMVPGQLNSQVVKVDAIMEADVYLSYGRSDHAEAVLKEEITASPLDAKYHLKLLDIFANEKNISKFDSYLPSLHKVTSGEGPAWSKAIALGKTVGSNHKLLRSDIEFAMSQSPAVSKNKNNFDQMLTNATSNVAPTQFSAQGIDFEFESPAASLSQPASARPLAQSSAQPDFFEPKKEASIKPPVSKKDPRIDLARAYLEMGDKTQAKSILLSFLDEATVKRIFNI